MRSVPDARTMHFFARAGLRGESGGRVDPRALPWWTSATVVNDPMMRNGSSGAGLSDGAQQRQKDLIDDLGDHLVWDGLHAMGDTFVAQQHQFHGGDS
ncbi:MAG: hypothetical protein WBW04_19760 [Nitrolancea sp.]